MDQQTGYSPSFKRPAEILRMRRRRSGLGLSSSPALSLGASGSSAACPQLSLGPLSHRRAPSAGGTKRRNPFRHLEPKRSPKKTRVTKSDEEEDEKSPQRDCLPLLYTNDQSQEADHQDQTLETDHQDQTQETDHQDQTQETDHQDQTQEAEHLDQTQETDHQDQTQEADHQGHQDQSQANIHCGDRGCGAPPSCTDYPADWSLKTRLVFTSPRSLSWAQQPKAQEEALALHQHCRAHFSQLPPALSDPGSCPELRAAFQQALVYWQHPSLPWLSLFPRVNASFTGNNCPWSLDTTVQHSLRRDWSLSLSSLYGLLKSGLCPYFYLCSYQFTVLFRAAGLGGSSSITAVMSPTTRGLREALKAEGIEFSLPLVEESKKSRREHGGKEEERLKDAADLQHSDEEDVDGSFYWLKEIGVEDQIKKPEAFLMQLQKENHVMSLDHKPESVALVEGLHTFTLINFLINSKSIVAAAGSQAGLPPTLLSPVAFRGASMHMLKSRCVNVNSQVDFSYQNLSSLEITGPVLPSSLHSITKILQHAQKGNVWAVLSTHRPTAVLNTHTPTVLNTHGSRKQGGLIDQSSCGLHPESFHQLLQPSSLGKTALSHMKMSQNNISWKS